MLRSWKSQILENDTKGRFHTRKADMGDGADDALDRISDIIRYEGFEIDGFDNVMYNEEDGSFSTPSSGNGTCQCKYCKADGLTWKQLVNGKWRLADDKTGELHSCKQHRSKAYSKPIGNVINKLTGVSRQWICGDCKNTHHFPMVMLLDDVWNKIANSDELLCIPCIEKRLERPIVPSDLQLDHPITKTLFAGYKIFSRK